MGAVRMRVQTTEKNDLQVIDNSSPSIDFLWRKKVNLFNKIIHHWDVFNFKPFLPAKIVLHPYFNVRGQQGMGFVHWKKCYNRQYFLSEATSWKNCATTNTTFNCTRCWLMDWSNVDYLWIIMMLLSAVWTHSDGTHSLQMIHLWASDVMLNFSKSVLKWSKLIYILDGARVSATLYFGVNYSINSAFSFFI